MRRVISVLCFAVGAVLLVIGTTAALVVGPDDVVETRPLTPPVGTRAVVVPHDLVPLTGVTLHVRARADRGDVLVGAAHPVDVASYTASMRRLVVVRAAADGRLSGDRRGPTDQVPLDLGAATFWSAASTTGAERSLRVRLTEEPVTVAAVAADPGARLRVDVGLQVPYAFLAAWFVAHVGGVVVGGGVLLARTGRRHGPGGGAGRGAAPDDLRDGMPAGVPAGVPVGVPDVSATARAAAHTVPGRARLAALAATVAVAGTAGLTGCAAVPGVTDRPDRPARPALTAAERAAPDPTPHPYQEAATAAAAGDPAAWARVTSGPEREIREYHTRVELARAARDGTAASASTYPTTTLEEIAPAFTSYPLYRLTLQRDAADEGGTPYLRLSERHDALATWQVRAETFLEPGWTIGGGSGASSAPEQDDLERAQAALEAAQHYLRTGDGAGIDQLGALEGVRASLQGDAGVGAVVQSLTVAPWGDRTAPFGPAGAARAVAADDGTVAVLALDVSLTLASSSADVLLRITDEAVADVVGQPGWRTSFRQDYVVVVAAAVSPSGAVTILGADLSPVHRP